MMFRRCVTLRAATAGPGAAFSANPSASAPPASSPAAAAPAAAAAAAAAEAKAAAAARRHPSHGSAPAGAKYPPRPSFPPPSPSSSSSTPIGIDDPFMRQGTAVSRFFKRYRQMPLPARLFGIFLMGFALGLVIETFACKTHLYESVMSKKDVRRHDFDEFVVDFRQKVEGWQRQDMERARAN